MPSEHTAEIRGTFLRRPVNSFVYAEPSRLLTCTIGRGIYNETSLQECGSIKSIVYRMKRGDDSMKRILLAFAAALVALAMPLSAQASLGGDVASVHADQAHLQGTLRSTTTSAYTVQELKEPTGAVVREYVSPEGKVFAVSWQGPMAPDLRQLLGSYFQTFTQAVHSQKTSRLRRAPLIINQSGFVFAMGGHMRWIVGRAYDPTLVPANVQMEEIR